MKSYSLLIVYATILQFITALAVLLSSTPILIARLGFFYKLFPTPYIGAYFMLASVFLSLVGLGINTTYRNRYLFFIPQFVFLLLTAGSALHAVVRSQYADGVIRPWEFIFIDQLPAFISVILYTFAIFDFRRTDESQN